MQAKYKRYTQIVKDGLTYGDLLQIKQLPFTSLTQRQAMQIHNEAKRKVHKRRDIWHASYLCYQRLRRRHRELLCDFAEVEG